MSELAINVITDFLDQHESAPSAYCLVASCVDPNFTEQDARAAYERSDGENDGARHTLLLNATNDQLLGLLAECLSIAMEKIESEEE